MYKVRDCQFNYDKYFHDGAIFKSKDEVIDHLAEYHSIDWTGVDDDDNPISIWEFLETLRTEDEKLEWILCYGQWELEEITAEDMTDLVFDTLMKNETLHEVLDIENVKEPEVDRYKRTITFQYGSKTYELIVNEKE